MAAPLSTVLVWAGPAQVIIISALGAGASPLEVALAVGLSGVRFLPMVMSLLPLIRGPQTRFRHLVLPAHLTAASLWIRVLPAAPAGAAGAAPPLLQWPRLRLHGRGSR